MAAANSDKLHCSHLRIDIEMKVNEIGFLDVASNFAFEGGTLTMSPEFNRAKRWVKRYVNEDGFVYPPFSHKERIDPITGKKTRVPRTTPPAYFNLTLSEQLSCH